MENNNDLKCPKCNSKNVLLHKKGFSGKKAVAGAVLTGGIGLLAGTIGSNNIIAQCAYCQHKFNLKDVEHVNPVTAEKTKLYKPIEKVDVPETEKDFTAAGVLFLVISLVFAFFSFKLFSNEHYFFGVILAIIAIVGLLLTAFATKVIK